VNPNLVSDGFELHRQVATASEIAKFCEEANRVAKTEGKSCVRHLRSKSKLFSSLPNTALIRRFIPAEMIPVRSILFDKNIEENWPVPWHQDLTIAVSEKIVIHDYGPWSIKDEVPHVQPPADLIQRMITARLHLDDTPESNGALRVIPGSHHLGKIPSHQIKDHQTSPEPCCSCQAGDLLLMSPLILHASSRSNPPTRRRVLHFEFAYPADLHPDLKWHE